MEGLLCELEFDVEALFNADLHLNRRVLARLLAHVLHDELFLLRDAIIVAIDDDVDEVAQPHHDAVVGFELLFNAIEREVVRHVVSERTGRLQVSHELQEDAVLVFVVEVPYDPDKLDTDTEMVQLLVLVQVDHDLATNILSILHKHIRSI